MPILPSGRRLAISRDALFDHGGNWFECPDGHFWHWEPDPEISKAPFERGVEIFQDAKHAPVPKSREEAKRFIKVLDLGEGNDCWWTGEMLDTFPRFTTLSQADAEEWARWLERPETANFLDETIAECERLAQVSRRVTGYAVLKRGTE